MSNDTDYVVIRPAPDAPPGWLGSFDGKWLDRSQFPLRSEGTSAAYGGLTVTEVEPVPTGRFETREDGAVAEVYEAGPSAVTLRS